MDPEKTALASSLFRRFRDQGDPDALNQLFELVSGELLALASHLATDAAQAEDMVQETFLTAIDKARRWDPDRPVLPWLIGILVCIARKERRRSRRILDRARVTRPEPLEGSRVALDDELRIAVEAALVDMPARYAAVLRPHLEYGRPAREIAAELGRAPGTVRVQLHRGLEHLRRLLPPGLSLGLGAVAGMRGMEAVRLEVQKAAIARAPALAAIGSGSVTLTALSYPGTVLMSMKSVAGLACLAVLGVSAYLGMKPGNDAIPLSLPVVAEVEEQIENKEIPVVRAEREEVLEAKPDAVEDGIESELVGAAIDAEVNESITLVGTVAGLVGAPANGLAISVRLGNPSKTSTTIQVAGNGPFEVDLGALTDEEIPQDRGVLVVAEGDGVIGSAAWATRDLSAASKAGRRYHVALEVSLVTRRLHGRVVDSSENPIAYAWVAFRVDDPEVSVRASFPEVYTQPDGSFALDLAASDSGTLILNRDGYQPRHVEIAAQSEATALASVAAFANGEQGASEDLGDLELTLGATISGHAFWQGVPATAGTLVVASAPRGTLTWGHAAHRLQIVGDRSVRRHVTAVCQADGSFELVGLEPGLEYRLVVAPEEISGQRYEFQPTGIHGTPFVAPSTDIQVDGGTAAITLLVTGNKEPIQGARAWEQLADSDPLKSFPTLYHTQKSFRTPTSSDGKLRLLLATGSEATLLLSAVGFIDLELTLSPDELITGAEIPVELVKVGPPATLTVELEYDGPGSLDGCLGLLDLYDHRGTQGSSYFPIRGGRVTFESVPSGAFLASVFVYVPASVALDDIPYVIGSRTQLGTLNVYGNGEKLEKRCVLATGGRIELHLVGRDPELASPQFELVDTDGNVVHPLLITNGEQGYEQSMEIVSDGPTLLGRSLTPGEWTLRQVGADYAPEEHTVDVRSGETTRLTVQLYPR